MLRILFDSNVYDKLEVDNTTRDLIRTKISSNILKVVISPIVIHELETSPFKGIPSFFPIEIIPEGVIIPGYAIPGLAFPSNGVLLNAHIGKSNKTKDAMIAETASSGCDIFVSEDNRCRKRLKEFSSKCSVFNYDEFKQWLSQNLT